MTLLKPPGLNLEPVMHFSFFAGGRHSVVAQTFGRAKVDGCWKIARETPGIRWVPRPFRLRPSKSQGDDRASPSARLAIRKVHDTL